MYDNNKKPKDLKLRTKEFSLAVIMLISKLPNTLSARVISNQVLRSATSIGANYREASRSRSKAEFSAKIGDCLKEAAETEYWFELLIESGIKNNEDAHLLLNEVCELTAILTSIDKKAKALKN